MFPSGANIILYCFLGTTVSGDNEGERTPVNTAPTFDDFYRQSNPNAPSWQDDTSKTPTPGMQEVSVIISLNVGVADFVLGHRYSITQVAHK